MDSQKKKGIILLMMPWILFALSLVVQILGRLVGASGASLRIINIFTLVLGMVAVVGFVPFIIAGIRLLSAADKNKVATVSTETPVISGSAPEASQDQSANSYNQTPPNTL